MPGPGINSNGQLNWFIFEVGYVRRDPLSELETVVPMAVHPLLVVPSEVSRSTSSRSAVTQSIGGLEVTRAGRTPWVYTLRGTFGVAPRGVPPFGGTGEERFRLFAREVVAFSDAASARDLARVRGLMSFGDEGGFNLPPLGASLSTPGFLLGVQNFDPTKDTPYCNFYDLMNNQRFNCKIDAFDDARYARRGGATGLVHYTMRLSEAGDVVASRLVEAVLGNLLDGLALWSQVNTTIEAYQIPDMLAAQPGANEAALASIQQDLDTLRATIPDATDIVNARTSPSPQARAGLAGYLGTAGQLADATEGTIAAISGTVPPGIDPPSGVIDWQSFSATTTSPVLDLLDDLDNMNEVAYAARFQVSAGAYFGLGRQTYAAIVSGNDAASGVGGVVTGARSYATQALDTPERIEAATGVPFERLLAINGLLPSEALFPGTRLQLPESDPTTLAVIAGLPVFDAHVGEAAWGRDLYPDLLASDGDFAAVSGPAVLEQGVEWLFVDLDTQLSSALALAPGVPTSTVVSAHVSRLILSDRRFTSVDQVVVREDDATLRVGLRARAISSGYVNVEEQPIF